MPLFPQSFIDDLRLQADIVQVVQEYVSLKRVGNSYKGLCPFHSEKTPSFNVNREQGFFHCFGCNVGGNVFKFLELHEKVSFPEAVRLLAQKFGMALPEMTDTSRDPAADAEREALLKMHEAAAALYREVLAGQAGRRARQMLEQRGITPETIDRLQLGFTPPGRDTLLNHLRQKGFALPAIIKSGLAVQRDEGPPQDRFWNRLMIPICREGGSIVAFGGRAMEADQQPKYLNSPETPIYTKGRTLYGLNVTKGDIRRLGYAVLVEGYFDFAQVVQGGTTPVVATQRDGVDAGAGPPAAAVHVEGGPELRPGRGRPGGGGPVVRTDGAGGISGQCGRPSEGGGSGRLCQKSWWCGVSGSITLGAPVSGVSAGSRGVAARSQ